MARALNTGVAALLLLLAATAWRVSAHRHQCIHDSPQLREIITTDLARGAVMLSEKDHRLRNNFQAQATATMRIFVSPEDLVTAGQYCTRAGDVVPNKQGGSVTCTADDVLTDDKKSILLTKILPAAITKLSNALLLEPLTRAIVVPQGACSGFTIPQAHTLVGVPDVDYVLYVGAAPTSESTLAWAGGCRTDSSGRIVVGRANFGPKYLRWDTASTQSEVVATAVHELMHALGFSETSFGANVATRTLRGKTAKVLTYPLAVSTLKAYLGCDSNTVDGVELEDEGGSGSAGSHFDRRVLKEELMTAAGGDKMSSMALVVLQASGHYTADFSKAEGMTWGRNAGCGYVTSKCDTTEGGRGKYWCFVEDQKACTVDYKAAGMCTVNTYTSDLPSYFQYFSGAPNKGGSLFFDGCPYVQEFSNIVCTEVRAATDNEKIYGHYFGTSGRCFQTSGLIASGYQSPSTTNRCLESRCTDGLVQLRVNGGRWETCTAAGQQMFGFSGYSGSVVCPDATSFCASFDTATSVNPGSPGADSTPTPGSSTTATTPAPTLSPPAPTADRTELFTTKGSLRFSGLKWREVLAEVSGVEDAVRLSISLLISVATTGINVERMSIGSLIVDYRIESLYTAEELDAQFQSAASNPEARTWLRPLIVRYNQSNATDDVRLVSHDLDKSSIICQWAKLDDGTCFVVFIGCAVILLLIVVFVLWCCCCRKSPEVEDQKIRAKRLGRGSPTEPYHVGERGGEFPADKKRKKRSGPATEV